VHGDGPRLWKNCCSVITASTKHLTERTKVPTIGSATLSRMFGSVRNHEKTTGKTRFVWWWRLTTRLARSSLSRERKCNWIMLARSIQTFWLSGSFCSSWCPYLCYLPASTVGIDRSWPRWTLDQHCAIRLHHVSLHDKETDSTDPTICKLKPRRSTLGRNILDVWRDGLMRVEIWRSYGVMRAIEQEIQAWERIWEAYTMSLMEDINVSQRCQQMYECYIVR